MNEKDLQIISHLRQDARIGLTDISKKTNIPTSTVFDRVNAIGEYVLKHTTLLDFEKIGYNSKNIIALKTSIEMRDILKEYLMAHNNVNNLYQTNSDHDFVIETIFRNQKDTQFFLEELERNFGIENVQIHNIIEDIHREKFLTKQWIATGQTSESYKKITKVKNMELIEKIENIHELTKQYNHSEMTRFQKEIKSISDLINTNNQYKLSRLNPEIVNINGIEYLAINSKYLGNFPKSAKGNGQLVLFIDEDFVGVTKYLDSKDITVLIKSDANEIYDPKTLTSSPVKNDGAGKQVYGHKRDKHYSSDVVKSYGSKHIYHPGSEINTLTGKDEFNQSKQDTNPNFQILKLENLCLDSGFTHINGLPLDSGRTYTSNKCFESGGIYSGLNGRVFNKN